MIDEACTAILARCARAEISPEIAAMELLIATRSLAESIAAARARDALGAQIHAVIRLLDDHAADAATLTALLDGDLHAPPRDASIGERVALCKHLFDEAVTRSEEASVALYSLGDPVILEAATREIVAQLDRFGVLDPGRAALDLGCGIGRMEVALAPRLRVIEGVDVSPRMIAAARRRCAGIPNARLSISSGLDLADFADESFGLVLAVDSFPYLVQAGEALARAHFREAARVLDRGGDLVILSYSYGRGAAEESAEVRAFADASDLAVVIDGEAPFTLWNARAFVLKKV